MAAYTVFAFSWVVGVVGVIAAVPSLDEALTPTIVPEKRNAAAISVFIEITSLFSHALSPCLISNLTYHTVWYVSINKRMDGLTARGSRWAKEDWLQFGADMLRKYGPPAMTVEGLCAAAKRTKGSFYHHFGAIDGFLHDLATIWKKTQTDDIASAVSAEATPEARLAKLVELTNDIDHDLEAGIRALAVSHAAILELVRGSDARREAFLASLLGDAYGLGHDDAVSLARLYHALHVVAQVRAPNTIGDFSAGPTALLRRLAADLKAART